MQNHASGIQDETEYEAIVSNSSQNENRVLSLSYQKIFWKKDMPVQEPETIERLSKETRQGRKEVFCIKGTADLLWIVVEKFDMFL